MPVETLHPSNSGLKGALCPADSHLQGAQLRLFYKGPQYFHRQTAPSRGLSAVERLEADKVKYVKSQQVALTRQAPIIRKALLPSAFMQPAPGRLQSPNFQHYTGSQSDSSSPSSFPANSESSSVENQPRANNAPPTYSSHTHMKIINNSTAPLHCLRVDDKTLDCSHAPLLPQTRPPTLPHGSLAPTAVRRIDVRPHEDFRIRTPQRRLWQQQAPPNASLATPLCQGLPSPPVNSQSICHFSSIRVAPPPSSAFTRIVPPLSPAFTHVSSCSSKGSCHKRPALHRSKSDLSDRFSRATADLERFFNYCGLDPDELVGGADCDIITRPNSDIISKLHSVNSDGSEEEELIEEGGEGLGREEEPGNERVPYQISVIERNARVIKWLYGLRQATGGAT